MNLTFTHSKIVIEDGIWLCLKVNETAPAREFVLRQKNQLYECRIKEHRKKRSLDANSYFWALLDKLADALNTTKESLYLHYIKQVGPYKDFSLTEGEAKTFRAAWERLGTGWPTEQVDFDRCGFRIIIRAYYGSSTYNTKQMSRLIDSIVEDCKELGIETLTPEKLTAMKEAWRA